MKRPRRCRFAFAIAPAASSLVAIAAAPPAIAANESLPDVVANCVDPQASIRFGAADLRAALDAADTRAATEAIVARYPQVDRDGNAPERIALWKPASGSWLFLALRIDAGRPGGVCVTASFAADRFVLTEALLRKYFGVGGPRT